jgi:hypothetical protein
MARWRLCFGGRHRRHAGRRRRRPAGQEQGCEDRHRRPVGRGSVQLLHGRRIEGRRQFDHRRHRARAHYREPEGFTPDFSYQVPDEEALPIIFDLLQEEGLCLGGSTGINIAGAIRLAKDLGPGHTIVTVLCDYGTRYQSKLFNPEFLRTKNLPVPEWMDRTPDIAVPFEKVA